MSFLTTAMVSGTPADITSSERTIEAFFPAKAETAAGMRALLAASSP